MKFTKNDQLVFDFIAKQVGTEDSKLISNQEIIDATGIKHAPQVRRTVERLVEKNLIKRNRNQNFNTYKLTKEGEQLFKGDSTPKANIEIVDKDESFYNHHILLVYNYLQDLTKSTRVSKLELIPTRIREMIKEVLMHNDRDTVLNILDLKYKEWKDHPHFSKNLTAKTLFKPELFYKYKQQLENKKKYEGLSTKRYVPKPVSRLRSEIMRHVLVNAGYQSSVTYEMCEKLYKMGYRSWQFYHSHLHEPEWNKKFINKYYPKGKPEREVHLFLTRNKL